MHEKKFNQWWESWMRDISSKDSIALKAVFQIRIHFVGTDPDPVFWGNADPGPGQDPGLEPGFF